MAEGMFAPMPMLEQMQGTAMWDILNAYQKSLSEGFSPLSECTLYGPAALYHFLT